MMPTMEASYQQFGVDGDDSEETPQEIGAMIHIVPESGRGKISVAYKSIYVFFITVHCNVFECDEHFIEGACKQQLYI